MFPKREEDQPTTLKRTLLTLWMNLDFESLAALNIPSLARLVGSGYYAGVEGSVSNPGLGGIGAFMFVLPCGKGYTDRARRVAIGAVLAVFVCTWHTFPTSVSIIFYFKKYNRQFLLYSQAIASGSPIL